MMTTDTPKSAGWRDYPRYPDTAIEALDDRFNKYMIFSAAVERLYTGARWSEGPVWFGDGRYLLWSDIPNNRILKWEEENLPEFINTNHIEKLDGKPTRIRSQWSTLFISGGRKDKISKGDIAGLFFKQGGLNKDELGVIELKQDCAFVAVPKNKADILVELTNNTRLKKKKVRITLA